MKLRLITIAIIASGALASLGCSEPAPDAGGAGAASQPKSTKITSSLPDGGFAAAIALLEPPAKLRAGQSESMNVRVRNASSAAWPALGEDDARFAITLRNRWLGPEGERVVNDLDGGTGLPYDLAPGAEVVLPLRITAPKSPGEYLLEVDMVQEQVNFFHDRGSQPAKIKVRVE